VNKIKFLGHASIYIETSKVSIVTDPWFSKTGAFLHSWFQYPDNTEIDFSWVQALDYVCISHEHQDHCDIEFLKTIPESARIVIPQYHDNYLYNLLKANLPNKVIQVKNREKLVMEDVVYTPIKQSVPGWNDCALLFDTPMGTIGDINDMKLTEEDLIFIDENFDIDYLFIQYSGASWYPSVYSNYDDNEKTKLAKKKTYNKFRNVLNIYERLNPKYIVPCAGPPCFLDEKWFYLNSIKDNSFPDQSIFYNFFIKNYDEFRIIIPIPGDIIDSNSHTVNYINLAHPAFTDKKVYLEQYKGKRKDIINSKLEKLQNFDSSLLTKCHDYFIPLMESSQFLTKKINDRIVLRTEYENIIVDFEHKLTYCMASPTSYAIPPFYTLKLESKYLNMIFDRTLTWEELLLSLRIEMSRTPDKYNEFLIVFLKFANSDYYKYYEKHYHKTQRTDTFELETNGKKYKVQKYCPHALGDLSKGSVVDGNIICPVHSWAFSLKNGNCINHNSKIFIENVQ
tara:strand:+ start:124 stop:1650 length:1527 start_codon:yes stop_codon:yes gene_type:complete